MSLWKDAKSPALKTEEAALLTAMPRHMAGGAALKSVAAQRGKRFKLSAPKTAVIGEQPPAQAPSIAFPRQGRNRAALYQVWKRSARFPGQAGRTMKNQ